MTGQSTAAQLSLGKKLHLHAIHLGMDPSRPTIDQKQDHRVGQRESRGNKRDQLVGRRHAFMFADEPGAGAPYQPRTALPGFYRAPAPG